MNIQINDDFLKSIDSALVNELYSTNNKCVFVLKHNNKFVMLQNKFNFDTKDDATYELARFISRIYFNCNHWQLRKEEIKKWNGYEIDFSAFSNIRKQTAYDNDDFEEMAKELIKQNIFTVEEIDL